MHSRASQTSLPNYGENNGSTPLHPEPLNVTPISCVPYTGPPLPYSYHSSAPPDINAGSVPVEADTTSSFKHAGSQPAMIFFTACPAKEDWDNLISHANGGVALTGSALLGKVGPTIGSVDIAESEDDYVFRVSLPGVTRDESKFCIMSNIFSSRKLLNLLITLTVLHQIILYLNVSSVPLIYDHMVCI